MYIRGQFVCVRKKRNELKITAKRNVCLFVSTNRINEFSAGLTKIQ